MSFEERMMDMVIATAMGEKPSEPVCNCRRQDSQSNPAGHELWCDIGYGPENTNDSG